MKYWFLFRRGKQKKNTPLIKLIILSLNKSSICFPETRTFQTHGGVQTFPPLVILSLFRWVYPSSDKRSALVDFERHKERLMEQLSRGRDVTSCVLGARTNQRRLQVHQQRGVVSGVCFGNVWERDSSENHQGTQMHEERTLYSHRQFGTGWHSSYHHCFTHQCL